MFYFRQLLKNYLALLLVQGGNFIFPLLVFPIIARHIGVTLFGEILFCYMVALYFSIIVDYGFNFSAVRKVSMMVNYKRLGAYFYQITFSKLLLASAALVILALVTVSWNKLAQVADYMSLAALLIIASMLSPYWLLQGVGKTASAALITLLARLLTLCVFLMFPITAYSSILMLVFPNLLAAIMMLCWVFQRYDIGLPHFSWAEVKLSLHEGWPVFVANSVTLSYSTSNTILLGMMLGPTIAGLYGAAERVTRSALAVMAPLCQAAYPIICRYPKEKTSQRNALIKWILGMSLIFGIVGFLGLNLFSNWIITLLFGDAFIAAIPILKILSWMLVIIPPAIVLAQLYLIANQHDKTLKRIYLYCSVIHCGYIFIFLHFWGVSGACYALLFTELCASLSIVYMSFKRLKQSM